MFLFNVLRNDVYDYDIETYPNIFTFLAYDLNSDKQFFFELSDRRWDLRMLCQFIDLCADRGVTWAGFNNLGFDYPVVHYIYNNQLNPSLTVRDIYNKAMSIIGAGDQNRFAHMVWENEWLVEQIDLYKIHHFDNMARATSLKVLEFNMRMDNIEDLPFPVGIDLDNEQKDTLITYNHHDVKATKLFHRETLPMIEFRRELTERYGKNFMNHNDTKIGKDYFIMELEKANEGSCYKQVNGKRQIQQTKRDSIKLADVVFPYIRFDNDEFTRILNWFKAQTITETKGVFKDISCNVNGFIYDFGTGGIHGSVESSIIRADENLMILDIDVKSYYPNIAIANQLHPAHLGTLFCKLYEGMYQERVQAQKAGNKEVSAMLKLALNGVYGDSNNQYSPFYDPQYTMAITINGQLLLCMLADALVKADGIEMMQINTDGLTIRFPRHLRDWVTGVCQWWEQQTALVLEYADYEAMFIRDCNNYIAVYTDGAVKRKGAYEYDLGWHQNHSALVVPKAVEAYLVHGVEVEDFIHQHVDMYDFFLRAKVPRRTILEHGGEKVSNIVRYFISTNGKPLEKVMPPNGPLGAYKRANGLTDSFYNQVKAEVGDAWDERIHTKNKSVYDERRSGINTGWLTTLCNKVEHEVNINNYAIEYQWYIKEAQKLIELRKDNG